MNDTELEFAQDYLEKLNNSRRLIDAIDADPNAPVDGARGIAAQLARHQEKNMHKILEILLRDAVERERVADPPETTEHAS